MHTITKTFKGLDEKEREETFYFDLTEDELMQLLISQTEDYDDYYEYVMAVHQSEDPKRLQPLYRALVLKAYGERDSDGVHFNKEDEDGRPLSKRFERHIAFSDIYMELSTNAELAAAFWNNVVPDKENMIAFRESQRAGVRTPLDRQRKKNKDRAERLQRRSEAEVVQLPESAKDERKLEDYSVIELMNMDPDEKAALEEEFRTRNREIVKGEVEGEDLGRPN